MPDGVVDEDALILPVDESDEKVAENDGDDAKRPQEVDIAVPV